MGIAIVTDLHRLNRTLGLFLLWCKSLSLGKSNRNLILLLSPQRVKKRMSIPTVTPMAILINTKTMLYSNLLWKTTSKIRLKANCFSTNWRSIWNNRHWRSKTYIKIQKRSNNKMNKQTQNNWIYYSQIIFLVVIISSEELEMALEVMKLIKVIPMVTLRKHRWI